MNPTPNPANAITEISISLKEATALKIELLDLAGRVVSSKNYGQQSGDIILPIQTNLLENGNYIIRLYQGTSLQTSKLIVAH